MHSPGPMTDYLINGMAAMIGKRDRRKPVAAYSGPIELDQRLGATPQDGLLKPSTVISMRRGREWRL